MANWCGVLVCADFWFALRWLVRISGLLGADWCGFLLLAGAPRRLTCHTLQSGACLVSLSVTKIKNSVPNN